MKFKTILATAMSAAALVASGQKAPETHEAFSRSLIAVPNDNGVFLSWRLLPSDSQNVGFDIYRDGQLINTNGRISSRTNFTDPQGSANSHYQIKTYQSPQNDKPEVANCDMWDSNIKRIKLNAPADGVTPNGQTYSYSPNDCSVGDVDGDGEYEIVLKWDPSNSHDNSHSGYTGNVILDCYEMSGKQLWRIDLGKNIRAGAHYTQFLVFDFDGDGKAEVACKTAPGSIDGTGKFVSDASSDARIRKTDNTATYANKNGHILEGPEFVTVFDGATGKALATQNYLPGRDIHPLTKEGWGDSYGNRSERYLATVAYLPTAKKKASHCMVFCRGYYTYSNLCAWQFDGKDLQMVWKYEAESLDQQKTLSGSGAHSVMAADVDNDGFDEIVYGAGTLDHNGKLLYNTGWGHGDALHVTDMDPDRPGLEVFMPHEGGRHAGRNHSETMAYGAELHDAQTGEILWCTESAEDNGRGLAADIDSLHRGFEFWSLESSNIYDIHGNVINEAGGARPPVNFRIYWDGDLCDELLDGFSSHNLMPFVMNRGRGHRTNNKTDKQSSRPLPPGVSQELIDSMRTAFKHAFQVQFDPDSLSERENELIRRAQGQKSTAIWKWFPQEQKCKVIHECPGATINGSKQNPCFSGDILGDWREEIILTDGNDLVICTTTIPSEHKVPTLPSDHTYRMSMTSQNAAYNQPPHLGYYLPDAIYGKKQ